MTRLVASSGSTASVTLEGKSGFTTLTTTITTVETSIVIPATAKSFRLKAHNKAILTYSHSNGGTSSTATSDLVPKYNTWYEEGLVLTGSLTIYIKSDIVSTDIGITYWI